MEYIAKTPFLGRTLCRGPTTKLVSETSPCHVIMKIAASHHNRVFVGNPAGMPSTVKQCKGSSTCNKEKGENLYTSKTWHNLGSELRFA